MAVELLNAAGARWRSLGQLLGIALPVLFLLVRMKEYRWRRMIVFLDPWADPQGAGYHVVQSLIALGCGGAAWVGAGRASGEGRGGGEGGSLWAAEHLQK